MGSLVAPPRDRWARVDFPGERLTLREARLLDERDTRDGPATGAHLAGYITFFVRCVGSIYKNTRAGTTIRARGKVCLVFYFGDAPSLSEADIRARWGKGRPRNGRFYEGNVLTVVCWDEARQWTREIAVLDADVVFSDLLQMGF